MAEILLSGDGVFGKTIQLFLADGTPSGLTIATMHGWTGSVLVARNQTLPKLLNRPECKRTGIYILFGQDPTDESKSRVYIGEADAIEDRLPKSAEERGDFWQTVAVITTSDESLTKGHVRFLEAELIKGSISAGRSSIENSQKPEPERRYLPEADRSNMRVFLNNIATILPVLGFDFLKPLPRPTNSLEHSAIPEFGIDHHTGVKARMVETDDAYIVKTGSLAVKGVKYVSNSYGALRAKLIDNGKLADDGNFYRFCEDVSFPSPSAAAAVVLNRNSNGRTEWKLLGTTTTYDEWQRSQSH